MRPHRLLLSLGCALGLACVGASPKDPQGLGGFVDDSIAPDTVVDAVVPGVYACPGVTVTPRTHGGATPFVVDGPDRRVEVHARSVCSGEHESRGTVVVTVFVGAEDPSTGEGLGQLRRRLKVKGDCAAAEKLALTDPGMTAPSEKLCTVGFHPVPDVTLDLAGLLADLAITGTVETVVASDRETRLIWTFNGTDYTVVGNARCEQSRFLYDDADSGALIPIAFTASDPEHRVGTWNKTVRFEHQLCSELPNARLREEIKREVQDLRATARIYERR